MAASVFLTRSFAEPVDRRRTGDRAGRGRPRDPRPDLGPWPRAARWPSVGSVFQTPGTGDQRTHRRALATRRGRSSASRPRRLGRRDRQRATRTAIVLVAAWDGAGSSGAAVLGRRRRGVGAAPERGDRRAVAADGGRRRGSRNVGGGRQSRTAPVVRLPDLEPVEAVRHRPDDVTTARFLIGGGIAGRRPAATVRWPCCSRSPGSRSTTTGAKARSRCSGTISRTRRGDGGARRRGRAASWPRAATSCSSGAPSRWQRVRDLPGRCRRVPTRDRTREPAPRALPLAPRRRGWPLLLDLRPPAACSIAGRRRTVTALAVDPKGDGAVVVAGGEVLQPVDRQPAPRDQPPHALPAGLVRGLRGAQVGVAVHRRLRRLRTQAEPVAADLRDPQGDPVRHAVFGAVGPDGGGLRVAARPGVAPDASSNRPSS